MFLKDTDGDDKADVRARVLDGLDSADTHHTSNSFALDPGGALYFQEGTFHHTQVETPYGPAGRAAPTPASSATSRGRRSSTSTSPSASPTRTATSSTAGARTSSIDGTGANALPRRRSSPATSTIPHKHRQPAAGLPAAHPALPRHRDPLQPALPRASARATCSSPTSSASRASSSTRSSDNGVELRRHRGRADRLLDRPELPPVRRQDRPRRRPLLPRLAEPDHRPHAAQPPRPQPRPRRTAASTASPTRAGRCSSRPKIAGEPIAKLLDLLKEPEDRVRYRARIELGGRDTDEVIAAVEKWVAGLDKNDPDYEHHLLEALWVHQYHNVVNVDLLKRMLASPDFRARAAATRVLCYWRDRVPDALGPAQEAGRRPAPARPPRGGPRRQLLHRARGGRGRR